MDEDDFEALLKWITADIIEQVDDQIRDRLRKHILHSIRRRGTSLEEHERGILSQLPLFREYIPCENESDVPYR